jgi:hypothetical protein
MRLSSRFWQLWLTAALVIAGLTAAVYLFTFGSPWDRVRPDQLDKLKKGMTEQEVSDILGKPTRIVPRSVALPPGVPHAYTAEWEGREIIVHIRFDSDGRLDDWFSYVNESHHW